MKQKSFLRLSLLILVFIGLMVAWLGFGERGFVHLYRMEKERQAYLEKITALEKENRELLKEIHRLRTDKGHIEDVARRELSLIKEDEVHYRFEKEKDKQDKTQEMPKNK